MRIRLKARIGVRMRKMISVRMKKKMRMIENMKEDTRESEDER